MSTKDRILELLEQQRGQSISGEHLAEILSVSRNAVWKAVKELQKDGYDIVAVTNKGYCLSNENDILSIQGIKPFLSKKSLPYANKIKIYYFVNIKTYIYYFLFLTVKQKAEADMPAISFRHRAAAYI